MPRLIPPFARFISLGWPRAFFLASGLAVAIFALNLAVSETRPGNAWGLAYGWSAALLMVGAAGYALRRRIPNYASQRGLGGARNWLQFHIYGGTLCLLMIFMHIGFRWPSGGLTSTLFLLSVWTILSGLAGVAIQKWYPRVLASGLSIEVLYQRVPELVDELRKTAEEVAAQCGEEVSEFYRDRLAPLLDRPRIRWIYLIDIRGGIDSRVREFEYLSRALGSDERSRVRRLQEIYRAKLEVDAHYTVQRLLRAWPVIHVPLSFALLALLVWHIFAVLYY